MSEKDNLKSKTASEEIRNFRGQINKGGNAKDRREKDGFKKAFNGYGQSDKIGGGNNS